LLLFDGIESSKQETNFKGIQRNNIWLEENNNFSQKVLLLLLKVDQIIKFNLIFKISPIDGLGW